MPFTPFHMGPAFLVKAFASERFSLVVFGLSQIAIDIEPLIRLLRRDPIVHGITHTYVGATVIGGVGALAFKPVAELLLTTWNILVNHPWTHPFRVRDRMSWRTALVTSLLGTCSHVFFDSLLHGDLQPWWPFLEGNGARGLVSPMVLHALSLLTGAGGLIALAAFSGDQR